MPIREYSCTNCGYTFELVFKTIAEDERAKGKEGDACPKCLYIAVRLPSRTSPPKFNGSGFHQNDYKS